jgi:teichuronic acid biosynthesis glycosyltransferase TuaH
MLMLMHFPWKWLKQRPHFLAENFVNSVNVTVAYRDTYNKKHLVPTDVEGNLAIKELRSLPFNRFKMIKRLNRFLIRPQMQNLLKKNDLVWLTYPELFDWVESDLNDRHFLIYDCMDDALEFPDAKTNSWLSKRLFALEQKLIQRANLVFCTAKRLADILQTRYSLSPDKIHIVNNAINLYDPQEFVRDEKIDACFKSNRVHVVYIGAVSEWFDFEPILESLKVFDSIEYLFFGPIEVKIPAHPRIQTLGTIPHRQVFQVLAKADVLVMPFKINDLVLGVNPIKVYEYIYSGKPALVKRYPETEKFRYFVHLYTTSTEYIESLRQIINAGCKVHDQEARIEFAKENSWPHRAKECLNLIMNNLEHPL